jgi:hypothetical protein
LFVARGKGFEPLWTVISVINVQSLWVKAIYKKRTNDKVMF